MAPGRCRADGGRRPGPPAAPPATAAAAALAGLVALLAGGLPGAGAEPASIGELQGRHAHWVLRTSSLQRSLTFYEKVFGMRVLRHEESPDACPITCNGAFEAPWSKTMVGYDTEDISYALELTFNYGVTEYPKGEALRDIAIRLRQPLMDVVSAAGELGWGPAESDGTAMRLTGPDGYRYVLMPGPVSDDEDEAGASSGPPVVEPFDHVRLRVRNLQASVDFYTKFLGMSELTQAASSRGEPSFGYVEGVRAVGYAAPGSGRSAVPLFLEETPEDGPVRVEQWEGRHAITLPASELRLAYDRIWRELPPFFVVHELRELKEKLGTLLIAIVQDPDGLEICLVSAEVFDAAAHRSDDFAGPDWELRRRLAAEREVPEESEAPLAANRPDWSFEDAMREHPEVFREASETAEKMWSEAMQRAEMNKEMLERAQEVLDSGDAEAAQAFDWETIQQNQKFVDDWVNRHRPSDPGEKAELERVRIKAGGGIDDKRLREMAERMAKDEAGDEGADDGDSPHDEL